MFLLVSVRHIGAHPGEHQHGVSIQISMSLGKTFFWTSRIRNIPLTWILARVVVYVLPFISQILDFIYWTVLIFILIYFEMRGTENQPWFPWFLVLLGRTPGFVGTILVRFFLGTIDQQPDLCAFGRESVRSWTQLRANAGETGGRNHQWRLRWACGSPSGKHKRPRGQASYLFGW